MTMCLYILLLLVVIHISPFDASFQVYGNERDQLQQYIQLTNKIGVDHEQYIKLTDKCFEGENTIMNCANDIQDKFNKLRLWETNEKQTDCSYNINFQNMESYINTSFVDYNFMVYQSDCKSLKDSLGGSNFEAFIQTDEILNSCHTFDYFNNTYQIVCTIPKSRQIRFSVLLSYEHYDGLSDYSSHLSSINKVLLDNYLFNMTEIFGKHVDNSDYNPSLFTWSDKLRYYSGIWKTTDNKNASICLTNSSNLYCQFKHKKWTNALEYAIKSKRSSDIIDGNFISNSAINYPILYQNLTLINNYQFYSYKNNYIIKNPNIINITINSNHEYYFIGASHMRYNLDFIFDFYYSNNINFQLIPRHHKTLQIGNMNAFAGPDIIFKYIFLSDQIDFMLKLCSDNNNINNPNRKITIMFQSVSNLSFKFRFCYVIYVMLCYVMLCYVMLCYVLCCRVHGI